MRQLITFLTVLTAGAAANADAETGRDPCSILADTVYRQVAAAGRSGWQIATLPSLLPAPIVCADTARAVSEGFSRAMAGMNLPVTWRTPLQQRGDACLSQDVSRCYPRPDPFVPSSGVSDRAFVVQRWRVVQASIGAAMPAGTASDISRFDPHAVADRLRHSLGDSRHVDGPAGAVIQSAANQSGRAKPFDSR